MAGLERVEQPVMVASIQTLVRRELPPAKIILIDECHHARAGTYQRVLDAYPDAIVVGLTATPWRLDGHGLGEIFDSLVVAATPAELRTQGYLCQTAGYAYVPPDFGDVATKAGDYDAAGLSLAYARSKVLGDIVDRWFAHCGPAVAPPRGRRTIVFASSIPNSMRLIEGFRARGVQAEHLDYKVPALERRSILDRVRTGATTVISNVGILGEGIDVPELECAILARPTKSLAVYLQQVGRVLRPAAGKSRALIHDHAGMHDEHGFWDDDRSYDLTADRPRAAGAASCRTCPECLWCGTAGTTICPECGYAWEIIKAPESDACVEVSLEELRAIQDTPSARRAYLTKLEHECISRRRKPGWIVHAYLKRYPKAPRPWGSFRRVKAALERMQ